MSDDIGSESNVFGRWDMIAGDIHHAVFALPRDSRVPGKIGQEAEMMYNEATTLHDSGTNPLRLRVILDGLSSVQQAFHSATLTERFNEKVFTRILLEDLTARLAEQEVLHTHRDPNYLEELQRATETLMEIISPNESVRETLLEQAIGKLKHEA